MSKRTIPNRQQLSLFDPFIDAIANRIDAQPEQLSVGTHVVIHPERSILAYLDGKVGVVTDIDEDGDYNLSVGGKELIYFFYRRELTSLESR